MLRTLSHFISSHTALPVRSLGMPKGLRGDRNWTADPNGPKGYPIPRENILSDKTERELARKAAAWEWLGISQWMVRNCPAHPFLCIYIEYYFPLPLLYYLTVFISVHKIYLFPVLPILLRGQLCGAELPVELNNTYTTLQKQAGMFVLTCTTHCAPLHSWC